MRESFRIVFRDKKLPGNFIYSIWMRLAFISSQMENLKMLSGILINGIRYLIKKRLLSWESLVFLYPCRMLSISADREAVQLCFNNYSISV